MADTRVQDLDEGLTGLELVGLHDGNLLDNSTGLLGVGKRSTLCLGDREVGCYHVGCSVHPLVVEVTIIYTG